MPFEMLVGLNVIDDDRYQAYRQAMMPILEIHSGDFGYDFVVSEVLKSRTANPINRVFTIHFRMKRRKIASSPMCATLR